MRYTYFLCFCLLFIAVDYLVHLNCCIMLRIIIYFVNKWSRHTLCVCVVLNSQLRELDIDVELTLRWEVSYRRFQVDPVFWRTSLCAIKVFISVDQGLNLSSGLKMFSFGVGSKLKSTEFVFYLYRFYKVFLVLVSCLES